MLTLDLKKIAQALALGAYHELCLTPKPGLVDQTDSGSHQDLSFIIMKQSIRIVDDYLDSLVVSLTKKEPFLYQQAIAVQTEKRMFSELGTNTHKGYIFLSGMLLIASSHAGSLEETKLRPKLCELAQKFFKETKQNKTNGQLVREKFNITGIVSEALDGFPSLFEVALPAFQKHYLFSKKHEESAFYMMAKLMQKLEDTTTLHRGGVEGLFMVRQNGLVLEKLINTGGNYMRYLKEVNLLYIEKNLTMGGIADLIGLALGYLIAQDESQYFNPNFMKCL